MATVKVLLVGDDALVRAGLRLILSSVDDIDVVGECADGAAAVAAVRAHRPDVVLMDIRMPQMDGIYPRPRRCAASVSTSYHLGYPEYRDADLRSPLIGTIVANVPTALTGNRLGAVVTHPMVHIAAVVHQRNAGSTQMLPPKVTTDYPSHGDSDVAVGLATLWLLATGGALTLVVRRGRAA